MIEKIKLEWFKELHERLEMVKTHINETIEFVKELGMSEEETKEFLNPYFDLLNSIEKDIEYIKQL